MRPLRARSSSRWIFGAVPGLPATFTTSGTGQVGGGSSRGTRVVGLARKRSCTSAISAAPPFSSVEKDTIGKPGWRTQVRATCATGWPEESSRAFQRSAATAFDSLWRRM